MTLFCANEYLQTKTIEKLKINVAQCWKCCCAGIVLYCIVLYCIEWHLSTKAIVGERERERALLKCSVYLECSNSKVDPFWEHTTRNYDEIAKNKKKYKKKVVLQPWRRKWIAQWRVSNEHRYSLDWCSLGKIHLPKTENGLCSSLLLAGWLDGWLDGCSIRWQHGKIVSMRIAFHLIGFSFAIFITCSFLQHLHNCNAICTYSLPVTKVYLLL